jgi:hypothetical protein
MEEFFSVAGWVTGDHYVASGATPPSEMAAEDGIARPLAPASGDAGQPPEAGTPGRAGRSRLAEGADQAVINESNGSSLSVTLAFDSTNSVTLFSTTMASTSAMRDRSDRYQRCTSTGFS